MKARITLLILLSFAAVLRADDNIANIQQQLKDQGFYYGAITGEKNADTTAAIRRYQIRNGLQITGELNEETLRSLRSNQSPPSAPAAKIAPSTTEDTSDLRAETSRENPSVNPAPAQPFMEGPPDRQLGQPNAGMSVPPPGRLFAATPYENSPPDVQRNVIADAQRILARRGLFKNPIDGFYGPDLEFSLRAYQSRVGLPITGRLDLDTLAALQLLPGAHAPVFTPRRALRARPETEPPVRGEWIRPGDDEDDGDDD